MDEFIPVDRGELEQGDVIVIDKSIYVIDNIWYDDDLGHRTDLHLETYPERCYTNIQLREETYPCRDYHFSVVLEALTESMTITNPTQIDRFLRPMAQTIVNKLQPYFADGPPLAVPEPTTGVADAITHEIESIIDATNAEPSLGGVSAATLKKLGEA